MAEFLLLLNFGKIWKDALTTILVCCFISEKLYLLVHKLDFCLIIIHERISWITCISVQ
jgi:hypothetical protein